ncbi:ORF43a [Corchorus olitorius]|uniref:ORF43a n=1 Tax=Corchorus olitorius TaxID=93759 RepID=A0A1R3L3Y2_9ROSI|nr:ORF43a [Corchorus olitorius]
MNTSNAVAHLKYGSAIGGSVTLWKASIAYYIRFRVAN